MITYFKKIISIYEDEFANFLRYSREPKLENVGFDSNLFDDTPFAAKTRVNKNNIFLL